MRIGEWPTRSILLLVWCVLPLAVACVLSACESEGDLAEAARSGDAAGLEAALKDGDARTWRSPNNSCLLHLAGTKQVAQMLIAEGVPVNCKNDNGYTPLHFAAFTNRLSIVRALVEAGADVNARNEWGITPISSAVDKGLAETYYDGYADRRPEIDDRLRRTVVQTLLSAGADPNIGSLYGAPLGQAVVSGYDEIVKVLLAAGADPSARDALGKTPMDYSRWNESAHGPEDRRIREMLLAALEERP
jgi:hypothetical protein